MERPVIKLPMDFYDWFATSVAFLCLILLIGLPIYHYSDLPATLPSHFGIKGQPDNYSSKSVLWVLPVVGTFLFILLSLFIKNPHWGNYLKEVTHKNAERQYRLSTKLLRTMRLLVMTCFFYIIYGKINIGLGNQESLNSYFLPMFLVSIFGSLGIYIYLIFRSKN